jgi:biopolymer transport protein ExbB/TolQ
MYLTIGVLVLVCLIVLLFGILLGLLVSRDFHRRSARISFSEFQEYESNLEQRRVLIMQQQSELQKYKEELEVKTKAIQDMIYNAHHKSFNPLFKTMRGLINLLRLTISNGRAAEYLNELESLILKAEAEWMSRFGKFEKLQ